MYAIDFLSRAFDSVGSVTRESDVFQTKTSWAIARYADVALARGWWTLESEGDNDDLEVRIRDDTGLIFACHPARQTALNLFLGESTVVDFDFVFCAWPGRVEFRKLKFRRLTSIEVLIFLGRRAGQAIAGGRPLAQMGRALRQLMSRSNFGYHRSAIGAVLKPGAGTHTVPPSSPSLIEKAVHKNFTLVLDEEHRLDERTLDLVAETFHSRPEVNAIYGDVLEGGRLLPAPQWDEERARWFQLARLPIFFRGDVEGLTARNAWSKLQEIADRDGASGVLRIPLPLAIGEVERVFERPKDVPVSVRDNWPTVSVVIPTKHRIDLLAKCLESLRTVTNYPNLEIVVVDNGADDAALGSVIEAASAHHPVIRVYDGGDFNFSRLINAGVKASSGQMILLLNDDVVALETGWLHRMVDSAMDASTGAVGARLLYSSGAIQHAGVMLGLGGICGHLWRQRTKDEAECNPHIIYPGRRMAVTGACLAVRRDAFDRVNGLDEINYPVTLNDIDFCLRLGREGLRTIYRGDAVLLHDESQSRGRDDQERRKRERRRGETSKFRKMWGHLLDDDPFGSPAFDVSTETGAVQTPRPRLSG